MAKQPAPTPLSRQAVAKKIGDTEYRVTPLGFLDARRVLVRLCNILGPKLSEMLTGTSGGVAAFETTAVNALGDLLRAVSDDDLQFLQESFEKETQIVVDSDRSKVPYLHNAIKAGHFDPQEGRFQDFFLWLGFCLQVNFARFFSGATWQSALSRVGANAAPKAE